MGDKKDSFKVGRSSLPISKGVMMVFLISIISKREPIQHQEGPM